jgi:hypothetical protein
MIWQIARSLKLPSSKCLSYWMTTYLSCFEEVCFNNRLSYRYQLCFSFHWIVLSFVWSRLDAGISQGKWKKLAKSLNFTFCYVDDVISQNNSKFCDYVTARSASYFDWQREIYKEGHLRMKPYQKEMTSIIPLWNFHIYLATFQQHLHMEHRPHRSYDIQELVVPIMIFLIEGHCL